MQWLDKENALVLTILKRYLSMFLYSLNKTKATAMTIFQE
jgi:hypothetical protein